MRRLPAIGLVLLLATGCSEPPQKEIDQAQAALDSARASGADKYAVQEYAAATAGLEKARAAVGDRDYRQALSYAIDSRRLSQDAIRQTSDGKARAKRAAETLATELTTTLTQLQTRINTAQAMRPPAKELRGVQATAAKVQTDLQEARAEIGAGNYDKATETLAAVRKKLDAAMLAIQNISRRPSRGKTKPRTARSSRSHRKH